jgi:hypothetical protein
MKPMRFARMTRIRMTRMMTPDKTMMQGMTMMMHILL